MIIIKVIFGIVFVCFFCVKLPSLIVWFPKFILFLRYKVSDIKRFYFLKKQGVQIFNYFGLKIFCGRQGSGKTVGMVWYLDNIRKRFPKCQIYTNFDYSYQTAPLISLNDLLTKSNGVDGVVFAIDELQNEFSSSTSRDFPESLLGLVTQQRKERICILASSQVYTRVSKPLREQCFDVIECQTYFARWTRLKCYDAFDYNSIVDSYSLEKKFKLPKKWKVSFVQSDELRNSYDTYAVVKRLSRSGFVSKVLNND